MVSDRIAFAKQDASESDRVINADDYVDTTFVVVVTVESCHSGVETEIPLVMSSSDSVFKSAMLSDINSLKNSVSEI